jgi:hypothetical protein
MPPFEAACAGAFVHGAAADAWARAQAGLISFAAPSDPTVGPAIPALHACPADRGMLASEIAARVPAVIAALVGSHAGGVRLTRPPAGA